MVTNHEHRSWECSLLWVIDWNSINQWRQAQPAHLNNDQSLPGAVQISLLVVKSRPLGIQKAVVLQMTQVQPVFSYNTSHCCKYRKKNFWTWLTVSCHCFVPSTPVMTANDCSGKWRQCECQSAGASLHPHHFVILYSTTLNDNAMIKWKTTNIDEQQNMESYQKVFLRRRGYTTSRFRFQVSLDFLQSNKNNAAWQ